MVHLVTELRRIRRSSGHDRIAWGVATLLAGIGLFIVVSELIGSI